MSTLNLIQALAQIAIQRPNEIVTSISFEDGSGKCFNYTLASSKENYFIRLN